jgi:hypothetical protein
MGDEEKAAGGMPAAQKPGAGEMSAEEQAGTGGMPGNGNGKLDPEVELEQLRVALRKANKDATDNRKRAEAYDAEKAVKAEAELSELQKAQQKLADLERGKAALELERQELTAKYEFSLAVLRPGSGVEPTAAEAAWKLVDRSELEFSEDGRPTNIVKVLKDLVRQYPFLAAVQKQQAPNINAGEAGKGKDEADAGKVEELKRRFRLG